MQGSPCLLGWRCSGAEWKPPAGPCGLLRPRLKVEMREEGRAPWPVPITRSPGPRWTDRGHSYPSVHKKPGAPAGQMGAAHTRVSTQPWAPAGRTGPLTPECPRSSLRAQALRPCVFCGFVCCTRTSRRVWAFTLLSCSVMSCRLPLTLQGGCGERAAVDQTGRVRPLPSFPPRLSAQTHHRPLCPLLVWRSARSVRGVSRVPPALPLLGGGCCEPPDP